MKQPAKAANCWVSSHPRTEDDLSGGLKNPRFFYGLVNGCNPTLERSGACAVAAPLTPQVVWSPEPVVSPERRQKLAQLLVRKAAAVESINQEHRAYFFRRQADEPVVISNERMREMLDELFD